MSYISALRTHTLVVEHKKLVGSTINSFKVASPTTSAPIKYNEVYLRNVRISGSAGAVPAVIYARFNLSQTQTYLSITVEGNDVLTLRDAVYPFYPQTTNDQERLIAHGDRASAVMNSTISLVTFDTTGVMTPFTDYTSAVVELVLR